MPLITASATLAFVRRYAAACAALRHAESAGTCGVDFARFGRRLGWRALLRNPPLARDLLLAPVSIVRYFEFPFALACLPAVLGRCLDISSPRLFSLYVAWRYPDTAILASNPDRRDVATTAELADVLRLRNIETRCTALGDLALDGQVFDCIWSLSVIEHVDGERGDVEAARRMAAALVPRGRLILSVPVDRRFWEEYRAGNPYGLDARVDREGRRFFQRYYDEDAIQRRIIAAVGRPPRVVRWFGEREAGRFEAYERAWMREGISRTVEDPREIADHYREFPSWQAMPGKGVCGLMFEREA